MLFFYILYWTCVGLLVYSYIVYPLIIRLLHRFFKPNDLWFEKNEAFPPVAVLMAAHNEAGVIAQKIRSVEESAAQIPNLNFTFWIGSDNSSDDTNAIVIELQKEFSNLHFFPFQERQGKPSIINQLAAKAVDLNGSAIFILTDANVFFSENTIYQLVKHFKNDKIAIVESNVVGIGIQEKGISKTEKSYVLGETRHKYYEGLIFKVFSGPMGGCFAIRSDYFTPVPKHHLVDDFYITMAAIEKGAQAIVEPEATCYEGISHSIVEEIRRKSRIGVGNFQNLFRFKWLWLKFPFTGISIVFFSHKIIRWLGCIFILLSYLALIPLFGESLIYKGLWAFHTVLMFVIPILYFMLEKRNIHINILRTITYFFAANLAMFKGLIRFFKGGNSSIWQPTMRTGSTGFNP
jgi:cellulose synthase/poly-beta-1,6-N-acetylglucosamine synthase-like glycosyltransferase